MRLLWEESAWEDYCYWQIQDKKTLKRINLLIKDIQHRLIYKEKDGAIIIASCKGHYSDK